LNFELNLFVHAEQAVEELRRLQQGYLDQSDRADPRNWPTKTSLDRLKMNLAKLFSPLL
jgi:hypothetical protein